MTDNRTPTEQWLEDQLKLPLIQIWMVTREGNLIDERHVADAETLFETVKMSIERFGTRSAVLPYQGRWCVYTPFRPGVDKMRFYDSREAAEMVMIHGG